MDPVEFLKDIVSINSVSQRDLTKFREEGHVAMMEAQEFLVKNIDEAYVDESGCVVAHKKAAESGPHVFLNTHMDVVPPHFGYEIEDGILRGRGACDAKGSLAVMATAFSDVTPESGQLSLVVSPDEESFSKGLYDYLSAGVTGDVAIIGEPTSLDVCPGARGHFDIVIEFEGESAHGSRPESGINAISSAAKTIQHLDSLEPMVHEFLGESSLTMTLIEGGEIINAVPATATLSMDRRSVPPETQESAREMIEREIEKLDLPCETAVRFTERQNPAKFLGAFYTDEGSEYASDLAQTVRDNSDAEPEIRPFDGACEGALFAPYMDTIVFGPGKTGSPNEPVAHSPNEYVPIKEVELGAEILSNHLAEMLS